jgi:hypothetical protein
MLSTLVKGALVLLELQAAVYDLATTGGRLWGRRAVEILGAVNRGSLK